MKKLNRTVAILMATLLILAFMTACSGGAKEAVSEVEINGKSAGQVLLEAVGSLVELAIAVAGSLLAYWAKTEAVPWLKDKRLYNKIKQGVKCAEQLYKNGMLQELIGITDGRLARKRYVINWLRKRGIELDDEVDAMIEAAVYELKETGQAVLDAAFGDEPPAEDKE